MKYASRRGRGKRKSTTSHRGRGGKVRRRLFRRRKTNLKRRTGNGGFANRTARRYKKGLTAKIVGDDFTLEISALGGDANTMLVMYDGGNLGISQFAMEQINAYSTLYDSYKVKRVVAEWWLNDNDEFSKPDTQLVNMWQCYDHDAFSKVLKANSIKQQPGVRRHIMMPGRVYRTSFKPKFVINNKNNQYMEGFNTWMDLKDISKTNASGNGLQFCWEGKPEQEAISVRLTYYFAFGGRRVNSVYQETMETVHL